MLSVPRCINVSLHTSYDLTSTTTANLGRLRRGVETTFMHQIEIFLQSLYLFTKSDIKTIMVPILSFAVLDTRSTRVFHSSIWVYIHLLQFCVSNQRTPTSLAEDSINKPWRPLPAGVITPQAATYLRWSLFLLSLFVSWIYGITPVGLSLSTAIFLHNEVGFDRYWWSRNLLNAIGYGCFDWGATSIARGLGPSIPTILASRYQIVNALVILTTIHAQDFRDTNGDRLIGRQTIPTKWPIVWARGSIVAGLMSWSILLGSVSTLKFARAIFLLLGVWTSGRFVFLRDPDHDSRSYTLYNIWLTMARVLPMYS